MYRARHARPSATKKTVTTGVGATLLPLSLAAPADASPATTEVRMSGPSGSVAPGPVPVSVRLLADGRAVQNGSVNLERYTGSDWQYVGRLLTNADGLGRGNLNITRDSRLRARYVGTSTRTADVSPAVTVDVRSSSTSTSGGSSAGQRAVQIASQQAGKPYRYGAAGPNAFDCSGLTRYVWGKLGKSLPHSSSSQAGATRRVSNTSKQPGDLIFVNSGGRITHVGIYAGSGRFWVAPKSGDVVRLQRIYTSSYFVGRV